jgi:hypothetical protein
MDANKILWNTITIRVPQNMIHYTPTGRITLQKSLTRLNNVSKRQRIPSINLMPSPDNKIQVISQGNSYTQDALRQRLQQGQIQNRINPEVKGYSWDNQKQKWKARIKINQRLHHLGYFDNEEQAHEAYLTAKRQL